MNRPARGLMVLAHLCLAVLLAGGCNSLPSTPSGEKTIALTDTGETRLARAIAPTTAPHAGQSGFHPLPGGLDSLVARLSLADSAQKCIDAQYYIWTPDDVGKLLGAHLLAAADRGVRVRILLDDFGTTAKDRTLLILDSHPNIEIRLFNPIALRQHTTLGMLLDFSRTNRRMHNKSFTVDNQAVVIGGRNIADEYFEATPELEFADIDVLATGPIVQDVSNAFDLYWNSAASYPISQLVKKPVGPDDLSGVRGMLEAHVRAMSDLPFEKKLREDPPANRLGDPNFAFYFGDANLFYDRPEKATEQSDDPAHRMIPKIQPTFAAVQKELILISPYFVPGRAGVDFFRQLRQRGVRIVVLTNSLASTDTVPVHAGYSRYRMELAEMGVELYEVKPTATLRHAGGGSGIAGSSTSSLHAKSFIFDRKNVFVGSMNLDPRSARLNTEIGVVFQNDELASQFASQLLARLPDIAWRVEPVPPRTASARPFQLTWVSQVNGAEQRLDSEPSAGFWREVKVTIFKLLPIENQL